MTQCCLCIPEVGNFAWITKGTYSIFGSGLLLINHLKCGLAFTPDQRFTETNYKQVCCPGCLMFCPSESLSCIDFSCLVFCCFSSPYLQLHQTQHVIECWTVQCYHLPFSPLLLVLCVGLDLSVMETVLPLLSLFPSLAFTYDFFLYTEVLVAKTGLWTHNDHFCYSC